MNKASKKSSLGVLTAFVSAVLFYLLMELRAASQHVLNYANTTPQSGVLSRQNIPLLSNTMLFRVLSENMTTILVFFGILGHFRRVQRLTRHQEHALMTATANLQKVTAELTDLSQTYANLEEAWEKGRDWSVLAESIVKELESKLSMSKKQLVAKDHAIKALRNVIAQNRQKALVVLANQGIINVETGEMGPLRDEMWLTDFVDMIQKSFDVKLQIHTLVTAMVINYALQLKAQKQFMKNVVISNKTYRNLAPVKKLVSHTRPLLSMALRTRKTKKRNDRPSSSGGLGYGLLANNTTAQLRNAQKKLLAYPHKTAYHQHLLRNVSSLLVKSHELNLKRTRVFYETTLKRVQRDIATQDILLKGLRANIRIGAAASNKTKLVKAQEEVAKLRLAIKNQQLEVASLQQQLVVRNAHIKTIQKDIQEFRKEHVWAVNDFMLEHAQLQTSLGSSQKQLKRERQQFGQLAANHRALRKNTEGLIVALHTANEQLKEQLHQLDGFSDSLQKVSRTLHTKR